MTCSHRYRIPSGEELEGMWTSLVVAWQISLANAHNSNNNPLNNAQDNNSGGTGSGRSTLLEKKW
ncbi:hypothetical protein EON64_19085, partial [archaeon]